MRQPGFLAFSTLMWAAVFTARSTLAFVRPQVRSLLSVLPRNVHTDREADYVEMMVGGERYSMVPLPDSMVKTTLFVGNLDEFVHDEDLSQLFQAVSELRSVPACVARKANMASLHYGFVTFPTEAEKEAAIIRYDGYEWRGKSLKVEAIRDDPSRGRVRIPERLAEYVSGAAKRTRDGTVNELRRISRDDVDRLSRGQPAKKKGYGSRAVPHRLNDAERAELDRASIRGFLVVAGSGHRRTRKASPLANLHRQWCDARGKPQIMVCKATNGAAVDEVVVDLSPLRIHGLFDESMVEDFLVRWKADILTAAQKHGLELAGNLYHDEDDDDDEEDDDDESDEPDFSSSYSVTLDSAQLQEAWATHPIWKLPVVSMGRFLGTRSHAKAMAKELALLWEIPEATTGEGAKSRRNAGARKGGRTKMKGLTEKRRGGGHRQAF